MKHYKVLKLCKAELSGWPMNERLCVEDPIDVNCDAAGSLRHQKMFLLRSELMRALTLCSRTHEPVAEAADPGLPSSVEPEQLMLLLCERRK